MHTASDSDSRGGIARTYRPTANILARFSGAPNCVPRTPWIVRRSLSCCRFDTTGCPRGSSRSLFRVAEAHSTLYTQ
eukprot:3463579-Prymnesium_polylepis.1